jgi:N-acetylmuramoyl-L-alanine amidase
MFQPGAGNKFGTSWSGKVARRNSLSDDSAGGAQTRSHFMKCDPSLRARGGDCRTRPLKENRAGGGKTPCVGEVHSHNSRVLKSGICLLSAAWLLAGCGTATERAESPRQKSATTARSASPLPPHWDSDLNATEPFEGERLVVPPPAPTPPPAPALPNPVLKLNPLLALPENGQISLAQWAARNGFGPVRQLPLTPKPAYAVKTPHGTVVVRAGNHSIYWERLEIRLGFAPQEIGGQIFLHALDIKKVLQPLAQGLNVVTPASRLVVIDPGHGGVQTGTRSVLDGRFEKDFVLDWAFRLAPLLEQSGWRVRLTRTNDVEMSLPDRVAFADRHGAHLFLSLHFNAAESGGAQAGVESYVLTPTGMPSNLTRGYADDIREVLPNNAFDDQNLRYAVRIHRALLRVNGNQDRGVRHARFLGVLRNQNRPAVLIEGGYLSNPEEARKIADPAYRQTLAEAIARALE